ncbi:hypothetical protein ACK1U3_23905 [Pseudomonas promysalinigenes]|uniref:hypothetical protein n=1 Tax=Pseudomonas promysalinigenes TaxID=485898 RepID=UPI00271B9708
MTAHNNDQWRVAMREWREHWRLGLAALIGTGISAIFLRMIPDYGLMAACPVIFALATAGWVLRGCRRRYQLGVIGIVEESIRPPVYDVIVLGGCIVASASSGIFLIIV